MEDKRVNRINQIVKNSAFHESKNEVLAFLEDEQLKNYLLAKLMDSDRQLNTIDYILNTIINDDTPFILFDLIKNNIGPSNNEFIIRFLQDNFEELQDKAREGLYQEEALVLTKNIIEIDSSLTEQIFDFAKFVLDLRSPAYKESEIDHRRSLMREKALLAEILLIILNRFHEVGNKDDVQQIIRLIGESFNLIEDDSTYSHYSPPEIFNLLKEFIDFSFEQNFKTVKEILADQYKFRFKGWKTGWDGWDHVGSGIGGWEGGESIEDRHYILNTLASALNHHYSKYPVAAWKYVKNECVSAEGEVNIERPDFLNRASIDILLEEYKKKPNSGEAFEILEEFVNSRRGIPNKADLVFQALKKSKLSKTKKWKLVKSSLDTRSGMPANIFVEQIITDLANQGFSQATKALDILMSNKKYTQEPSFERKPIKIIEELFEAKANEANKHLRNFLEGYFEAKPDKFKPYKVANLVTKAIIHDANEWLPYLLEIAKKEKLLINEQLVITAALEKLDETAQLVKAYDVVIEPIIQGLDYNIKKIEQKFTERGARESIVNFAQKLAKHKKIEKAFSVAKVFIADSDPPKNGSNYPDDPEGTFNYHEQVEDGKDTMIITTVRGHLCWTLQNIAILQGRKFIPEITSMVKKLTTDDNFYVRQEACVPLSQLARIRNTNMPDSPERFLDRTEAENIEKIAFDMLTKTENHKLPAVMKRLTHVFGYIRSVTEEQAWLIIENFMKMKADEDVIADFIPLLIFFAEFRSDAFTGEHWAYLKDFNSSNFKEELENVLKESTGKIRGSFAWQFGKLIRDSVPDNEANKEDLGYTKAFNTAFHYFDLLVEKYEREAFDDMYSAIKDNIDNRYEKCYRLWTKCLEKERPALFDMSESEKDNRDKYWYPFHYNGTILRKIYEQGDKENFLYWLDYLLDYTKDYGIGDIDKVIDLLKSFPKNNTKVNQIFDKLIDRNPSSFYDDKEEWQQS